MKADKPIYYVSARPEAYEFWGEVGREEARRIAEVVARRAAARFPTIEFRVDDAWHDHLPGMELVAAHIDANWQKWLDEAAGLKHAA